MPIFKPKTSKQITVDAKSVVTLDGKHSSICATFEEDDARLVILRAERKVLKQRVLDNTDPIIVLECGDRLRDIAKEIGALKERKTKYFLDNSELVFDYFEEKKRIGAIDTAPKEVSAGAKTVKSFFKMADGAGGEPACGQQRERPEASVVQKYLANVDTDFLDMGNYVYTSDQCPKCGKGELISVEHEGVSVCNWCGGSIPILIENEKPSYKEPPKEVCFYAYKRINHFREILAQFQAKETTQIPDEVLDNIRRQIQKERIEVPTLNNKKAKEILKKLGYNKYYEHIPFIKDKLGIKPPVMSQELEETLCSLFMDIQGPYARYIPDNRVNFLNYYYTVYKLCELLEQTQFLPFFPMLKDMGKRIEQDAIWKQICEDLNWEFIPTV